MNTSAIGLQLIKNAEGLRLNAYPDPGTGGVPYTIGYGHTLKVKDGDVCTEDEACQFLLSDVQYSEHIVNDVVKVPLSQNQFDALVSFVFNVGERNFKRSTLLSKLNDGDYIGASLEFNKWRFAAGKLLPGLVKRRQAETELFTKES